MNVHPLLSCKFTYKLTGKMNKKAKFLFFCMIFVVRAAFGQENGVKFHTDKSSYFRMDTPGLKALRIKKDTTQKNCKDVAVPVISSNFYTQNFGFFCKKELQLEKVTKIPFKFRLGSVQQVDWMEGKTNALRSF